MKRYYEPFVPRGVFESDSSPVSYKPDGNLFRCSRCGAFVDGSSMTSHSRLHFNQEHHQRYGIKLPPRSEGACA